MDHAVVGGIVNNLPIDKMVSAPLIAAIKAQTDMSMALAHFVKDVGIDEKGQVRMVTFNYQEDVLGPDGKPKTQDRHIEAPFLALTGIPNLAIEDVHISFDLEVSTAEDDEKKNQEDAKVETEYKSWWSPVSTKFTGNVTHSSSQTRHTDTRAKYTFNVRPQAGCAGRLYAHLGRDYQQCRYSPPGNQEGQSSSQRKERRYSFWRWRVAQRYPWRQYRTNTGVIIATRFTGGYVQGLKALAFTYVQLYCPCR